MHKNDFPQILKIIRTTPELSAMEERDYIDKTELNNLIKLKIGVSVVAAEGDEVLGFAYGILEPTNNKTGWLYHLAVKRKAREKGIGSKLLKAYEKEIRKRGVKTLLLFMHFKPELKKFYKRHGYKVGKTHLLNALKDLK